MLPQLGEALRSGPLRSLHGVIEDVEVIFVGAPRRECGVQGRVTCNGTSDFGLHATNDMVRKGYKECTSLRIINKVATTIYLLEGLLPEVQEQNLIRFIGQVHLTC